MRKLCLEEIDSFIEGQLDVWPLAKKNHDGLAEAERREIALGDLKAAVQFNPARIVSTGAKLDAASLKNRKCFLCLDNRPKEQMIMNPVEGWDVLVNPFPILPVHLTIVNREHRPQDSVPYDIVTFAEMMPGMAVFFNGAKAGASAPDHLHMQAVLKDELPLLRLVERHHPVSSPGIMPSYEMGLDLPFLFFSGVVNAGQEGMATLYAGLNIGGNDCTDGTAPGFHDKSLVNTFFWIDASGMLRFVAIPRRAHRPGCFYSEGDGNRMVSPGCIDMAGLLITPRREDFMSITADEIRNIYADVAFPDKPVSVSYFEDMRHGKD